MSLKVDVRFSDSFRVDKDPASTYRYFADIQQAVPATFPGLEQLTKVEDATYRWQFKKIGYSGYNIEMVVVTRFEMIEGAGIKMHPVPTENGSQLTGEWKFSPDGSGTKVEFSALLTLELPIPSFLRGMATTLTQTEVTKLFQKYMTNAANALA